MCNHCLIVFQIDTESLKMEIVSPATVNRTVGQLMTLNQSAGGTIHLGRACLPGGTVSPSIVEQTEAVVEPTGKKLGLSETFSPHTSTPHLYP